MISLDYHRPYPSARSPVLGRAVAATSHPAASTAAVAMLLRGGNAVDAAVAAAMALTVVEPTGCGVGGNAFAILWDGQRLYGLDAAGRSPAAWTAERFASRDAMPDRGWESVTTPGAVSGWATLVERFGRLTLAQVAEPAIALARDGFPVSPIISALWRSGAELLGGQPGFAAAFMPNGSAPRVGETFRNPDLATTLESIAETRGESFYRGELAERIVAKGRRHGAVLSLDDMDAHRATWVEPLAQRFGAHVVHELPAPGQGVAALMALGILEARGASDLRPDTPESAHMMIEATKLALADLYAHVADPEVMGFPTSALLDPGYLADRASRIDPDRAGAPVAGLGGSGSTVCLSVADADGMMISFIQSNYMGFGSGAVVPGAGVSLHNRGAGFVVEPGHPNTVGPSKKPFHSIIPGFATDHDGRPRMAFGVMGGPMQPQGHVQLATRVLGCGLNPQAAIDAPRWRALGGRRLAVEAAADERLVTGLSTRGHEVSVEPPDETFAFGGAQAVLRLEEGWVAGSDPRKDGQAAAVWT